MAAAQAFEPLMMTIPEFARLHSVSEDVVRECIVGKSESYPPLRAKRVRKGDSKRSRIYITAEAAREWRAAINDA